MIWHNRGFTQGHLKNNETSFSLFFQIYMVVGYIVGQQLILMKMNACKLSTWHNVTTKKNKNKKCKNICKLNWPKESRD